MPVISIRTPGVPVATSCTLWPAPSRISPPGAVIVPELSTVGPIRYTLPPCGVVMLPSLLTAPAPGLPPKVSRFARKSLSLTARLLATKPATLIIAPLPTMMPAGLISHTRPLALSVPNSDEGLLPATRFKTDALAPVWANVTLAALPILKEPQLMMAVGVVCVTVICAPL